MRIKCNKDFEYRKISNKMLRINEIDELKTRYYRRNEYYINNNYDKLFLD